MNLNPIQFAVDALDLVQDAGSPGVRAAGAIGGGEVADVIGDAVGDIWDETSGTNLTHEQMAFNALEAQKARDFSASEAERAHQRNVDFASSAYSRQADSMRAAGLNTGLMYGGGAGSPMTPHSPQASSAQAQASSPNFDPTRLFHMLTSLFNLPGILAQTAQSRSSAALTAAQEREIDTLLEPREGLIRSQAYESSARGDTYKEEVNKIKALVRNLDIDTEHKISLVHLVNQEVLKLEQDIRAAGHIADSAEQAARIAKIQADFADSVGGSIQRWSDAVGLKGRDITQLIGLVTGIGKLFGGANKNPFGFHK